MMAEPLYRINIDESSTSAVPGGPQDVVADLVEDGVLVPVEPDIEDLMARLNDFGYNNRINKRTVAYLIRNWWARVGGDDPNVAICNCGTVTTGERWCDDCLNKLEETKHIGGDEDE